MTVEEPPQAGDTFLQPMRLTQPGADFLQRQIRRGVHEIQKPVPVCFHGV